MKFKESHRSDILKSVEEHGLKNSDISFVKKKGRIIIKHTSGFTFSFYQKEDFDIDMKTRERIDMSTFEIKINNEEKQIAAQWSEVIILLQKSLAKLS